MAKGNRLRRQFLAEWRKYRELSQGDAGARLRRPLDQGTLSRIERGDTPYDRDHLEDLAELYKCTPADLLEWNPLVEDPYRTLQADLRGFSPNIIVQIIEIVQTFKR